MEIISKITEKKYNNGKSVDIDFFDKVNGLKVGHLSYDVFNKGSFAVLYHAFIKESYRKQGIIKNNFRLIEKDLKKEGINEIRLNSSCYASDRNIWENFGFEEKIKGTKLMTKKLS